MKTVGLAMIVKDGADVLDVCLHSARGLFDQIVVVDTGSSDNSREIARKFGAEVYDFEWADDFAAARNFSFTKLQTHWAFWLDDDDMLVGHEKFSYLVERAEELDLDAVILEYYYSLDPVGQQLLAELEPKLLARAVSVEDVEKTLKPRCNTTQYRERLIKLDPTWQWRYPIHEALPATGRRIGRADQVKIIHRRHIRQGPPKKDRNLRILERIPLHQRDERIWFYLGLEYAHHGKLDESINAFNQYIPQASIEDEKYQAFGFRGDLYRAKNDLLAAESSYLQAIALRPTWRSAYIGLLNTTVRLGKWEQAGYWAKMLQTTIVPETPFAYNPVHEQTSWAMDFARAMTQLSRPEEARDVLEMALKVVPENQELQQYLDMVSATINVQHGGQAIGDVVEFFLRHDDAESAALVLARTPASIRAMPRISEFVKLTGRACARANAGEFPVGQAGPLREEVFPQETSWKTDRRVQVLMEYFAYTPDVRKILVIGGPEDAVQQLSSLGRQATVIRNEREITGEFNGAFDGVVLWSVLEQVKSPDVLVSKCRFSLRPGGWLYAWVPNGPASRGLAPPGEGRIRMRAFDVDTFRQVLGTVRMPFPTIGGQADAGELILGVPTTLPPGQARRIAIVCPGAPEPWGWTSLGEGIGGSEEAVIRLSRAFLRRGHSVTVYGSGRYEPDVRPEGEISYKPLSQYSPADVLLAWRHPEVFLGQLRQFEAEWRGLWLHDSVSRERIEAVLPMVDMVWCISDYHASLYAGLPKIYRGRNGIDSEEFDALDLGGRPDAKVKRNPNKIVYVSTPFRGLDTLLEQHWPEIKRRVPAAELHAYYGWESADRMGATATPEGQAFKQKVQALCEQPGVYWHGRVGQPELYREVRSAGVWAYPTRWKEEHCISAYIAQACGAWPVVYPLGALPQSVVFGWKVEAGEFTDAVVEATKTHDGRERMMSWTRQWTSWDDVASLWERLWRGLCA